MGWSHEKLNDLLTEQECWIVSTEEGCLTVTNDEGIDAFVFVGEQQLIAEVPLFPESQVQDVTSLNELILASHQMAPLTSIYKKRIGESNYYVAFGALSLDSKDSVVLEEVETLFANVDEFLELYADNLKKEVA